MHKIKLGIVGATSMIAKELVEWMNKWRIENGEVHFYDTKEHVGYVQCCCDHYMPVQEVSIDALTSMDILIFCDEALTKEYKGVYKDCYCIYLHHYEERDHMIIPHMNGNKIQREQHSFYIPEASVFILSTLLSIAKEHIVMQAVDVTSLHSVAECGYGGCIDLQEQIQAFANKKDLESKVFPLPSSFQQLPLLFQALPQTSSFLKDGKTETEAFLIEQCKKIAQVDARISATCVRIAALRGVAMNINMHTDHTFSIDELVDAYASSSACICIDDIEHDMYPICADVIHDYRIYIGRMRKNEEYGFQTWAVCDDLSIRCAAIMQVVLYLVNNFFHN